MITKEKITLNYMIKTTMNLCQYHSRLVWLPNITLKSNVGICNHNIKVTNVKMGCSTKPIQDWITHMLPSYVTFSSSPTFMLSRSIRSTRPAKSAVSGRK